MSTGKDSEISISQEPKLDIQDSLVNQSTSTITKQEENKETYSHEVKNDSSSSKESKEPKLDISRSTTNQSTDSIMNQNEGKSHEVKNSEEDTEIIFANIDCDSNSSCDDACVKKTTDDIQSERAQKKLLKKELKLKNRELKKQKQAKEEEKNRKNSQKNGKPQVMEPVEWRYDTLEKSFSYISSIHKSEDIFSDERALKEMNNINATAAFAQANQRVNEMKNGFNYGITKILVNMIDFFNVKVNEIFLDNIKDIKVNFE